MRLRLEPADESDLDRIATWLADPAYWADAFLLPTEPDPPWVKASMLMIRQGPRLELTRARFWAVREDAELAGFAIDYGWDTAEDGVREIDCALVGEPSGPRLVELFGELLVSVFGAGAMEIRCRVRAGKSGRGFDRLFARVGAEPVTIAQERHPVTGEDVVRAHYRCTPDMFYASRYFRSRG